MQTRGIAIKLALTVTQAAKRVQIIFPRALVVGNTEFQGGHRLHQRGTIELAGIDHQLFAVVHFQGMGHIGFVQKLTGYP